MPQVYSHRTRRRKHSLGKRIRQITVFSLLILIAINAALYSYYKNRTYPNTYIMSLKVGNRTKSGIAATIGKAGVTLLPKQVMLAREGHRQTVGTETLGIRLDASAVSDVSNNSWFPLAHLFKKHTLPAPIRTDRAALAKQAQILRSQFLEEPVNASITLRDASFTVAPSQNGFALDTDRLEDEIIKALRAGKTAVDVPIQTLSPKVTAGELSPTAETLNRQLKTRLNYRFGSHVRTPNAKSVAEWYAKSGNTYEVTDAGIGNYLLEQSKHAGMVPGNVREVIAQTRQALLGQHPREFNIVPAATTKTIRYCVSGRGVNDTALAGVRTKLVQTYSDIRGWTLDGQVQFREVASGCDFTVWLSSSSQMPTFGGVCDAIWSCRIGTNVVINQARWDNASPAWNQFGGTLDDYHNMVINHETGHWIGFGHDHCAGRGKPAPVMQQQSIDLQGCTFNPWPNSTELAQARAKFGL